MAADKRTTVRLSEKLLRRARKTLKASTNEDAVTKALPAHGFTVQSAQMRYRPKNPVKLNDAQRAEVEAFLEAIDADDDVQEVYPGLAG